MQDMPQNCPEVEEAGEPFPMSPHPLVVKGCSWCHYPPPPICLAYSCLFSAGKWSMPSSRTAELELGTPEMGEPGTALNSGGKKIAGGA